MALSRFEVNSGAKGKGLPHFLYITGQGKYKEKDTEIIFVRSENMPRWAESAAEFWSAGDEFERKNGSVYREHLLSLPRELSHQQNIELIDSWIEKHLKHHSYTYAYHETVARDGRIQPHCHLMFSERVDDGIERTKEQYFKRYNSKNPEKGGVKKLNTGKSHADRQQDLAELRDDWGEHLKEHLRNFGFDNSAEKVDMRNYIERGAEPPEPHKPIWIINAEREILEVERAISEIIPSEPAPQAPQKNHRPAAPNRDDGFDYSW